MASSTKFRAAKRFHFSDNGTQPWAVFEEAPGSNPPVYEFETSDTKVIARLDGHPDIEKVTDDKPAARAAGKSGSGGSSKSGRSGGKSAAGAGKGSAGGTEPPARDADREEWAEFLAAHPTGGFVTEGKDRDELLAEWDAAIAATGSGDGGDPGGAGGGGQGAQGA